MSKFNIKKLNRFHQRIEPTGQQKVPIDFHISTELMPDEETIKQLVKVASDPHVFHHVSALSDIHKKPGRKNPSGTVVATKKYFLPQLLDTAPNCGMRLMTTPFTDQDLSAENIDALFRHYVKTVPTKTYFGSYVSKKVVLDICRHGNRALTHHLQMDENMNENMLMNGNMFDREKISLQELRAALPDLFFRFAQFRLGILGAAGNHFLDLMKITEILEPEIAKKFGVYRNQYVFLLHTGSGLFGQYASYFYTPKQKEHFSQKMVLEIARLTFLTKKKAWHRQLKKDLPRWAQRDAFYPIDSDSELGQNYYLAHRAAGNYGFANRTMIQYHLERGLKKILGQKISLPVVYDMSHVYANKEKHFGEEVIVNRSNTTRAFGPQRMRGTKFATTGEPLFMPSSMSTPAYLGVGTDENKTTFFSAAHGTGKSVRKTSSIPKNKRELFAKMRQRGVRLYNARSRQIIEQDAGHYKDPEAAIQGMVANKIMRPVAKMQPVAVLMY